MPVFSNQQIKRFIAAALECSFYLAPEEAGLTYQELIEAGTRYDLKVGEINDTLQEVIDYTNSEGKHKRLFPRGLFVINFQYFIDVEEPEYRDIRAFDHVYKEWRESSRVHGVRNVQIDRNTMIERAVTEGIDRLAIKSAVAILVFRGTFTEKSGILRPTQFPPDIPLPSETFRRNLGMGHRQILQKPERAAAYSIVKDIISRRSDGRPLSAEPLDAFAGELEKLNYGQFRLWWQQIVANARAINPQTTPVATIVLYAALVEGALTFVVRHARTLQLGTLASKTFEGPPTSWKIEDLINSAASGKEDAILDDISRHRAISLTKTRQRIHAGRMLSDFPGGPPDLRPEEARDAKEVTEMIVRRVLDWLRKFPR